MRNIILLFLSVAIVGCSTFVKRNYQTEKEYYEKINKALADKNVFVHFFNNGNAEGKFISINNDSLLLQTSDTLELRTKSIHSISYQKSDPTWFNGAIAGLACGSLIVAVSGAELNLVDRGKYPYMFYAIPAGILIGIVAAEGSSGGFKTFILNDDIYDSK